MQISTKGRYALRLMLDLAVHNTGELVKIKDISARENISEKYLEQNYFIIKEGGICKEPERGTGRLYACQRAGNIYGGNYSETDRRQHEAGSLSGGEPNQCSRAGECVTLRLWKMLDEAIEGVLDKVTLQDLKDWYEEMGNDYVI